MTLQIVKIGTKMKLIKIHQIDLVTNVVYLSGRDGDADELVFGIRLDNLSKSAITRGEDSIIRAAKVRLKRRYKGFKFKFND